MKNESKLTNLRQQNLVINKSKQIATIQKKARDNLNIIEDTKV